MSPTFQRKQESTFRDPCSVVEMRRELAEAERILRWRAERDAAVLADAEREALRDARNACLDYGRICPCAESRLAAMEAGGAEDFLGEAKLAEMVLRDAKRADAAYTVIAFAGRRDKLRYLRGGEEREAVLREALKRGGVFTERNLFQEIVR